jgi:ribonucleoside-diphosphate reductase alpha chain
LRFFTDPFSSVILSINLGVISTPLLLSALICGGVSQGIEPLVANVYNQPTAAGEISRLNPTLINLLKSKGVEITPKLIESITDEKGSVKNLNILTEEEKLVFKTAYEINQKSLIRLASSRQPDICQAQSLNLFFDADEDEGYIAEVHQEAFEDENIKALYYMRTAAGVSASKGACVSCEA